MRWGDDSKIIAPPTGSLAGLRPYLTVGFPQSGQSLILKGGMIRSFLNRDNRSFSPPAKNASLGVE